MTAPIPAMGLETGVPAPDFRLPDTAGQPVALADFIDCRGLVVAFICNHCPYVRHVAPAFAELAREYIPLGIGIVGVNANDSDRYPEDSPEAMVGEKARQGYPFPYLHDAEQTVARAYGAVCTPEFFLFDDEQRLVYHGRFDGTTPGSGGRATGEDLRAAVDALLTGRQMPEPQMPAMGCSIKWRPAPKTGV